MRMSRSLLSVVSAFALGGALALSATPAWAHAALVSSDPPEAAFVTGLTEVRLEFSEPVLDIGASVAVRDATGVDHAGGLSFPTSSSVQAPVGQLPNGPYTLEWRVVAADGHPVEGVVRFTVGPDAAAATPDATADSDPTVSVDPSAEATMSPTPRASMSASPTASTAPGPDGSAARPSRATGGLSNRLGSVGTVGIAALAGVALVVGGLVVWRRIRRARSS